MSSHQLYSNLKTAIQKIHATGTLYDSTGPFQLVLTSTVSKSIRFVAAGVASVLNSTLTSSVPSGDIVKLSAHYGVTSEEQKVLPIAMYLVGYVFGPLFFGPLSEGYGRRSVMLGTFAGFTLFTMATALAPDWAAFNTFRFITGIFASSPISVIGG